MAARSPGRGRRGAEGAIQTGRFKLRPKPAAFSIGLTTTPFFFCKIEPLEPKTNHPEAQQHGYGKLVVFNCS